MGAGEKPMAQARVAHSGGHERGAQVQGSKLMGHPQPHRSHWLLSPTRNSACKIIEEVFKTVMADSRMTLIFRSAVSVGRSLFLRRHRHSFPLPRPPPQGGSLPSPPLPTVTHRRLSASSRGERERPALFLLFAGLQQPVLSVRWGPRLEGGNGARPSRSSVAWWGPGAAFSRWPLEAVPCTAAPYQQCFKWRVGPMKVLLS